MSQEKQNLTPSEPIQMGGISEMGVNLCGRPLRYSIRMSFAQIIPPIYILTVQYEGKEVSYNFRIGETFQREFEATGPLGIGTGVLISLSDWTVFGAEESAELKFTAYSALALCGPVTERINF
jgi:hypothetical protein